MKTTKKRTTKNGMTTMTAVVPAKLAADVKEFSAKSGLRMAAVFTQALPIGLEELKRRAADVS